MEKIRWGIISTAAIGARAVIPGIKLSSNGVVAAVASRDLARAQAFAEKHDIPQAYGSYDELINAPNIDAIYNPLPNSEHAKWSIACAEAGKAALCEKPLASNAEEAQQMVDAFDSHGVLFAEAFMYRFHPQTVRVKQLVKEGAIGTLNTIATAFTFPIGNEDDIRLSAPLAGGALMDVGCYCVNVMRHMTDEEPVHIEAFAEFGSRSGVDERITGIMKFPSGVLGHMDASFRTRFRHWYELTGDKGRILVEEGFVMSFDRETTIKLWNDNGYEEITIAPAQQYTVMVEDFADALLNKRPPTYLPQDAVNNMKVIDAMLASARAH